MAVNSMRMCKCARESLNLLLPANDLVVMKIRYVSLAEILAIVPAKYDIPIYDTYMYPICQVPRPGQ